jgi:hypothetical protein
MFQKEFKVAERPGEYGSPMSFYQNGIPRDRYPGQYVVEYSRAEELGTYTHTIN